MTKQQFREWTYESLRILDGATGTELQKMGMPAGVCPEAWSLANPDILKKVQREYIENGSDIVYTFTLGGSGPKLKEFGIDRVEDTNRELAKLSKEAADGKALVAGDIGPTGQMMQPFGIYSFEDIVKIFKEQVRGLLAGGVDLFAIETMMDIQEARAALLAVRESCDLPVIVTMTFGTGGRTINGTDPLTALATLQNLGADAVGCNCSTGPKEMLEIVRSLKPYAMVPLVAKPNAGLPRLVDQKTVFDMEADEFSAYTQDFIDAGVSYIGGCCGTSPEFIRRISRVAKNKKCAGASVNSIPTLLTSSRKIVFAGKGFPICLIGDRINAAEDTELQEELKNGSLELATQYAMEQIDEGAQILEVNADMPGIDEAGVLAEIVSALITTVHVPLCFSTSSPVALESALRIYPGRALIKASPEGILPEDILKVAEKYGAAVMVPSQEDQRHGPGIGKVIETIPKHFFSRILTR